MCQKFRKAALNKFQIITFSGTIINAMKFYIIKALKYLFSKYNNAEIMLYKNVALHFGIFCKCEFK